MPRTIRNPYAPKVWIPPQKVFTIRRRRRIHEWSWLDDLEREVHDSVRKLAYEKQTGRTHFVPVGTLQEQFEQMRRQGKKLHGGCKRKKKKD
ncbi:hypothetical protein [Stenotrophomonas sp. GD03657]|uniref:hypothetical protein n=1 Tax=Stenotrophomonas sp. GD03657 TaxID=2975363 RepID=UPI002448F0EA|nr:hypothetical protein [Stenotrophomonas sp. GD03657]MDH2154145.1 hypothetical protein [Stenotrophomonas sp. GD03657]